MPLILYATLGTADIGRATRFYDAALAPLGQHRTDNVPPGWVAYGGPTYDDGVSLFLCSPFDGRPPNPGNGPMIAFGAKSVAEVRAFHAAAVANGGSDEGAPGTRAEYGPSFYAAYVRDPDGNKLACVHHHYAPTED